MPFEFRPAVRSGVGLIVGLSGASGSGKTYSALRLASGMAGEKRFAMIDTEAGRAQHYADSFAFDHGDLEAPFSPAAYTEAIQAADAAAYPVIVVDSVSHEWAGDGGILEMHETELDRMAGDDWKKREACKIGAWVRPKMAHKGMIAKLLQCRAHLILCFRAESKIEIVKGASGHMEIRPKQSLTSLEGWIPITEKNLPYELTASALLMPDRPGVPQWIKLQEQHKPFFPAGEPITEASGAGLASWASGAAVKDWASAVACASDLQALAGIGAALNAAARTIPDATLKKLRRAYKERAKELEAIPAPAPEVTA